jgi:hypothetical protein
MATLMTSWEFGTVMVFSQKTLNKHAEKSTAERAGEDKKTDVDWIHSDSVVTNRGILTGIARRSHEN